MGRNIGFVCNRSLCGTFERNALIIHLRKKTLYQYCWHRKQTLELEWHKMSFHDNQNAVCSVAFTHDQNAKETSYFCIQRNVRLLYCGLPKKRNSRNPRNPFTVTKSTA